jgi:molecular chaperone GrpE
VLADFQAWLADALAPPPADGQVPPAPAEPIDVSTLLEHFVALRQEVNLQTRAVRGQQEQNAETLRKLGGALDALERAQALAQQARDQGAEELLRPLLKTLIDVYDALALAAREAVRVQEAVLPQLGEVLEALEPTAEEPAVPAPVPARSWWARWFGAAGTQEARAGEEARQRAVEVRQEKVRRAYEGCRRVEQLLASLLTGYTMSLQRLERALRQQGLEPIPAVGQPFDPERMEVLEAVTDSGRPAGEVLQEVRRGYLWNGRVFRYAQVRVAKS